MHLPDTLAFTNCKDQLCERAIDFLTMAYHEETFSMPLESRKLEVLNEIEHSGTWTPTYEELALGARMAWRNSNRCIGRLFWKSLKVFDARTLDSPEQIFSALENHIEAAFRNGQIMPCITVFQPHRPNEKTGPRIINNQLISYGATVQPNGSIMGDPKNLALTHFLESLGYRHDGQPFTHLPVALSWPGQNVVFKKLKYPDNIELCIEHPEFDWFADLGVKWYTLPVVSDMLLEIGGIHYTAAPFNGWYMGTEIGSRNLADPDRYNLLPEIASKMGLNIQENRSLWIDKAMVELNRAVLYSFDKNNIKIASHHEAASQFLQFERTEAKKERCIHAEWSWIVPPLSPSATPVFHKEYNNHVQSPNFFYQESVVSQQNEIRSCPFHKDFN
jgi:nitric-oxide synthase